jgi:enediyne biosynthesis protein E4
MAMAGRICISCRTRTPRCRSTAALPAGSARCSAETEKAVPARESGLLVAGDGQALALADLTHNGWPDLIVSRHNSSTLAFANLGHPERASFGVRLHAAAGGPGVVGARVTVRLRDGSTQTSEVHAGGGYLSQSTLTLFFGYPADAPPTEIEVRWPDRRSTLMAWERHTPLVRINQE